MSGFIGNSNTLNTVLATKDSRIAAPRFLVREFADRNTPRYNPTQTTGGFISTYWPRGGGFLGDQALDYGVMVSIWSRNFSRVAYGASSRVGFVGVTRDSAGGRLGAVTCSLFRTSDRQWIMDVVSDVNGDFLLQSWYSPDTHFIVFSKTGAPDVIGTTRQTLVGA